MNKNICITIVASILLIPIIRLLYNFTINSPNRDIIERFLDINFAFISMYTVGAIVIWISYFIHRKGVFSWYSYVFYGSMLVCLCVCSVTGYLTHGESIRALLFFDSHDALMDFYNSISHGMHPYADRTIYPPLISVFYSFLGRYMLIESPFDLRETQMGILVYGMYVILFYGITLRLIFKSIDGSCIEKYVFTVVILLSSPFIFLYERGNSVLIALVFIWLFLRMYNSENLNKRIIGYICISVAISIKIAPIIFTGLVLRKKRYCEFFLLSSMTLIIFITPFCLTDGNMTIFINNLQYTSALYQGVVPNGNQDYVAIGHGCFVNFISTISFISRLMDVNLYAIGNILNIIFAIVSALVVLVPAELDEWKLITILCGLMILLPGFSGVYCLVYMVIPLIMFINSKPNFNKINLFYMICFVSIFILVVNIKLSIFSPFFMDFYPERLSTAIESIAVLLLFAVCLIEGIIRIYYRYFTKCKKYIRLGAGAVVIISVVVLSYFKLHYQPCSSFYPENLSVVNASAGIHLKDGAYQGIDDHMIINLLGKDIKENGLVISINNIQHNIAEYVGEEIEVFINGQIIKKQVIEYTSGEYIYIDDIDVSADGNIEVEIKRKNKKCDRVLPISYIGAVKYYDDLVNHKHKLEFITNMPYYNRVAGIYRENSKSWIGCKAKMLIESKLVEEGFVFEYDIPPDLLLNNNEVEITVLLNGELVSKKTEYTYGTKHIIVNRNDISVAVLESILKKRTAEAEIVVSHTQQSIQEGEWYNKNTKSISINKFGAIDYNNNYLNNISAPIILNDKFFYDDKLLITVNDILFDKGKYICVYVNGQLANSKKISNDCMMNFIVMHKNKFKEGYNRVDILCLSNNMIYDINAIQPCDRRYVRILYAGHMGDNFDKYSSNGFEYDKTDNLWYIGYNGEKIFANKFKDGKALYIKYNVDKKLLLKNKSVKFDIYINGILIKNDVINNDGDYEVVIRKEDVSPILSEDDLFFDILFRVDNVYNLYYDKITNVREKRNNRSIGIKEIKYE